jgi:phenylacetate-coenzyme A ligase PaaK-like adenylate-forming protein
LQELPVLTKATLMQRFDELATDPAVRLDGLRAHVAGQRTERMKMAAIGSTAQANQWHPSSQAGATFNSRIMRSWMPTLALAANEPVTDLVRKLNDWQLEMFAGYPSILRVLADEQLGGRLRVHPHFVMSGSEVLTDETRSRVEAAWGRVLFEAYGTTESGGGLAAEFERHEGLHLFEDLAIVEVVDEQNRPVPAGVDSAKVPVTVLGGRTLPLIRYEIEDSVRMAGSTGTCGRPFALIERILGRSWDALRLPAIAGGEVTVQPLTFTAILDTSPITGWQVVHKKAAALTVLPAELDRRRAARDHWSRRPACVVSRSG